MGLIFMAIGAVGATYVFKNKENITDLKNKVVDAVESAVAAFKDKLK